MFISEQEEKILLKNKTNRLLSEEEYDALNTLAKRLRHDKWVSYHMTEAVNITPGHLYDNGFTCNLCNESKLDRYSNVIIFEHGFWHLKQHNLLIFT